MEDNFLLSRGVRVKEERMRLSLTQQQCADACGVSRVQWGKYERDVNALDGEVLKRFIALGADGSYILGGIKSSDISQQRSTLLAQFASNGTDLDKQSFLMFETLKTKMIEDRFKVREKEYGELIEKLGYLNDNEFQDVLAYVDFVLSKKGQDNKASTGVVNAENNSGNITQLNGKKNKVDNRNQSKTSNYHAPQQNSSISVENHHGGSIVGINNE